METGNSEGTEQTQNIQNGEYPEDRKEALYIRFKEILFEKRNKLLNESDKYMLVDFPTNQTNKDDILKYRQDLRDYPALSFFDNFNGDYGEGERLLPKLNVN